MSAATDTKYVDQCAILSTDGVYRYELSRCWDESLPTMAFVMLNPSTADASVDDPTIRKCVGFGRRAGYGSIRVLNLYAYRATDPRDLVAAAGSGIDIVGPDNDAWLTGSFNDEMVVAAWGASVPRGFERQPLRVTRTLRQHNNVWCLGRCKDRSPRHPLMVAYAQPFEIFSSIAGGV